MRHAVFTNLKMLTIFQEAAERHSSSSSGNKSPGTSREEDSKQKLVKGSPASGEYFCLGIES